MITPSDKLPWWWLLNHIVITSFMITPSDKLPWWTVYWSSSLVPYSLESIVDFVVQYICPCSLKRGNSFRTCSEFCLLGPHMHRREVERLDEANLCVYSVCYVLSWDEEWRCFSANQEWCSCSFLTACDSWCCACLTSCGDSCILHIPTYTYTKVSSLNFIEQ